jgi:hypothetical protein
MPKLLPEELKTGSMHDPTDARVHGEVRLEGVD